METGETVPLILCLPGPKDFASDSKVIIWDLCVPLIGGCRIILNLIRGLASWTTRGSTASPSPREELEGYRKV